MPARADPHLRNNVDGRNALEMAAYHGRGDVLALFERRGLALEFSGRSAASTVSWQHARGQIEQARSLADNSTPLDQLL